jgi:hypothetical protein
VRATRASLSCSRTALTDAPPTSTIFLSLAATRPSLRARSRHGLGRPSVLRSHCRRCDRIRRLSRCDCSQPLMCRFSDAGDDDRLCTLKRPAFEKRRGRKSRSVVRRWFGWLYGDLAAASGLGWVVMIHTPVRLDRDPAVNERVARRATRICGTSGCELSGSRRAWALSAASRRE